MKKLLLIAFLMLALVITAVACNNDPVEPGTSAEDVTTAETPTQAPDEPETPAPDTDEPETPKPDEPETPAPVESDEPETPKPEVPTQEPETDPPVDPADPVWIIDADGLAAMSNANAATVEKNEAGYASFTATGGDPWFLVCGNIGEMPEYMVLRYRTNTSQSGEFFISDGAGPEGGKSFIFNYENNGEWNLLIFHLPTVAPYMTSNVVGHIRYDFFTGGADEGFLEVAYLGFFNTAEYALAYDFEQYPPYVEADDPAAGKVNNSFDTFYVNGGMYFPEDGGAGDKLTAQDNTIVFGEGEVHDSMVLRGWIGFSQPMASFGYYVDNYKFVYGDFFRPTEDGVLGAGGEHASRFEIAVPLNALEGGIHKVGFIVKLEDGTVVRLREDLKVIIVPETTDDVINLATGHGAPFSGAPNNYFGQRYDIGETILKKVTIADMATYTDGNENTWTFKVWQWNTDYATTVAAAPLFEAKGENHPDNTTFNMDIPTDKFISGDIYYEISYDSGTGCFTGWTSDTITEGVETYVAGSKVEGAYSASLMVGTPVTEEEIPEVIPDHQLQNPPVYIIKAKDMMMTNANQMKFEKMDGFVHFIPTSGDPNFMLFNNQTGSRYAVIKYRTEYQANIQIFLGSTGAGPSDDTVMMEQALNPDGQWHLAIFDTNVLVERGVYDGTTAAYLRLDVMESGYVLDENGEPSKDEGGAWLKLPLPEGATIDIAYFAFFETEEKINKFEYAPVVTDKTVYNIGEPIMITATGADKDWVGIARADETTTIRWWYVADAGSGVAINALDNAAIQAGTGDAIGDLPAGDYYVVWVPNDQSMDGAEGLCRYPITIVDPNAEPDDPEIPEGPAQDTHNFQSNAAGNIDAENPADVDLKQSDLAGVFAIDYGQGDAKPCYVKVDGFYQIAGFQAVHAAPDGAYAFSADNYVSVAGGGFTSMFFRGVKSASKEGQFFGSDGGDAGAVSHGGAGIYLTTNGSVLTINVKSYTDGAYVSNKFNVSVEGHDITVVDDGATAYILVGGKTVAKIEISGVRDFGIANTPADALAEKVVITLADGTSTEVANAIVAADYGRLGFATRGHGHITLDGCSLMPYNTVSVPEMEKPAEPAEPVFNGIYHTNIDFINGTGPNGGGPYSGLGGSKVNGDGSIPVRDAAENGITVQNNVVTIAGWMAVAGGIHHYAYSVDGGELIAAAGGADGEPLPDYYKNLGMPDSTKNGLFNGGNNVVADLSAYAGKTVSVTFYAIPETAQDTKVGMVTITGLVVPAAEEPEEPVVPDEPTVETLVIPQDQWVISGHCTTLVGKEGHDNSPMVAAGGVDSAALLHQGSIALGEIDLSKYSKVVIMWGSDNGPGTQDLYAKNEHNRFALVNADKNMVMSPAEDTIIAATTYELHGWAVAPIEIDLTGIDYNGPLFLTHDSLTGGFALVYSIEFVA